MNYKLLRFTALVLYAYCLFRYCVLIGHGVDPGLSIDLPLGMAGIGILLTAKP